MVAAASLDRHLGPRALASIALGVACREFDPADEFVDEVVVWVHEEDFEGRKLSEVVNETKMNPKYFPGYHLGDNIRCGLVARESGLCRRARGTSDGAYSASAGRRRAWRRR